jgi:hypothetical protein
VTYQSGPLGKIQASDINSFLNTGTPNINGIWAAGSGNSGYGQPEIPGVTIGQKISSSTWISLIDAINKMANHQGTTILSMSNSLAPLEPAANTKIRIVANNINTIITDNIKSINTNRLNAAAGGRNTNNNLTLTNSTPWNDKLTFTFTIKFASDAYARYYFNCGGQIGLYVSHPQGFNINRLITEICSNIGTLWLSSPTSGTALIEGSSYHGVTQSGSGGVGGGVTLNQNVGFYSWTSIDQTIITQKGSYSYRGHGQTYGGAANQYFYNTDTIGTVAVKYNSGEITITMILDEVPNKALVSAGTTATLMLRPPSTTYLPNSWGSPTISGTQVASSSG